MTKRQKQADELLVEAQALAQKACLLLARNAKTARPIEFGRIAGALAAAREALSGEPE